MKTSRFLYNVFSRSCKREENKEGRYVCKYFRRLCSVLLITRGEVQVLGMRMKFERFSHCIVRDPQLPFSFLLAYFLGEPPTLSGDNPTSRVILMKIIFLDDVSSQETDLPNVY